MKNNKKNILIAIITIILFILMSGLIMSCNTANSILAPSTILNFPFSERYRSLVVSDGQLIVLVEDADYKLSAYAKENEKEFTNFPVFDNNDNCDLPFYFAYETLPDGRLQVWRLCLTGNGTKTYLMAYDWQNKELDFLIRQLPLGSSGASWNSSQSKAIGFLDSKFASKTLFWITNDGFEPLNLIIGDQNKSWNLQDDFPDFKADDNGKTGTTGRADWSPDGKTIAFFASTDAIGKIGFERFEVIYSLYLLNPDTIQYKIAVDENVVYPYLIEWSPDSKNIAFIGRYGFWKEKGLWIYSLESNSVQNIGYGQFDSLVWRADSKHLVAIHCKDLDVCSEIVEYDLTDSLNK